VHTCFAPYSPSYTLSPSPLSSHGCQPSPTPNTSLGRTCSALCSLIL
jgi:hypothetical protein